MSVPRFSVSLAAGLALLALVALGVTAALAPGPHATPRPAPAASSGTAGGGTTGGRGDGLVAAVRRDEPALTRLLDGAGRVARAADRERRTLPGLVHRARQAAADVRAQEDAVDTALRLLPGTLQHSTTTMRAVRTTLHDVTPLVTAAGPATATLAPLLRRLRGTARAATPAIAGLRPLLRAPGRDDDLTGLLGAAPALADALGPALEHAGVAAHDARPLAASLRAATPDAVGVLRGLTQTTGAYDANGHAVQVRTLVPAEARPTNSAAGP